MVAAPFCLYGTRPLAWRESFHGSALPETKLLCAYARMHVFGHPTKRRTPHGVCTFTLYQRPGTRHSSYWANGRFG